MSDLARLFQQQVPLDSKVKITLTNGKEVTGILDEISRERITLRNEGKPSTIFLQMIGMWEVLADDSSPRVDVQLLDQSRQDMESISNLEDNTRPIVKEDKSKNTHSSENGKQTDNSDLEISTKIIEINAHFTAYLHTVRIEILPPDFVFPAEELNRSSVKIDAKKIWDRMVNKYNYAQKIKELSSAHGRIQGIIADLEELAQQFPMSPAVSRHLAYVFHLAGQNQNALKHYQDAVSVSLIEIDLKNLAAVAIDCEKEELVCYSLEQLFQRASIDKNLDYWYIFVKALLKFSNHIVLVPLWENILARKTEQEIHIFINTMVYLLKINDKEDIARRIVNGLLEKQSPDTLVSFAFDNFEKQSDEAYQRFLLDLNFNNRGSISFPPKEISYQRQGFVHSYKGKYGFLRDQDGKEYFFHFSAVTDLELLPKLEKLLFGQEIPVTFQLAQGPKGDTIAVSVSAFRTTDETFKLALRYADEGEYNKAISQIKKVLTTEPDNQKAQALHDKWREYARMTGVPQGKNPYARAKQVQLIEKDLDRAEKLLRTAIKQRDNWESAIKDLAMLLDQLGRTEEAIELLEKNRNSVSNKQAIDNLLTGLYSKAEHYDHAITLLNEKLKQATTLARKIPLLWQIGNAYLRQEKYTQAEQNFVQILRYQRNNQAAERNLAICLFKQERLDEAEKILNRILNNSLDTKAAELLDAIKQARQTGQFTLVNQIIIELTLSDLYLSGEASRFTKFFLDRCQYEGVKSERIQAKEFSGEDIKQLEELATKAGPKRPSQMASYYLSAAKIASELDEGDQTTRFYEYLCQSFVSMADATVSNGHIDSVKELYCEALSAYDNSRTNSSVEREAENALIKYLYSTLGNTQIPSTSKMPTVYKALEDVINLHPERNKVFDAIAYVVYRSRYGANNILNRLNAEQYTWRAMALDYLNYKGIYKSEKVSKLADFTRLWKELQRRNFDDYRTVIDELRSLSDVEITTATIEPRIEVVKRLIPRSSFELDQKRLRQLQRVLEIAADLCRQEKFSDQERLAEQIERNCQELLDEIENNPTKISIEEIYLVVEAIRTKINVWKEELYNRSAPDLSLRLAIETYTPDRNNLNVQVAVANRPGCSPAESLELIVHPDKTLFSAIKTEVKLYSSLEGGGSEIVEIPLRVTDHAISSQAFSLPLYGRYKTRSGDTVETSEYNFSIRLSSEDNFEEIQNPYAPYAESGVVQDEMMFYGREELIQNVATAIQNSLTKSVVIYGQKRAGKSSILYHLKKKLQTDKNLLVLDWGNIGSIRDKYSKTPLLYQILWGILEQMGFEIEDKTEEGFNSLQLPLPTSSLEFYSHPDPLTYFNEIFQRYKRVIAKLPDWRSVRVVLLIDEFTYIFDWILQNEISNSFMKNWKALLQENYFSAVLVGQDYMPKFKLSFPNEFGTTQDERVTYLRKEDAIRLIDEPIRIGGRLGESRYREQAIETIFSLTAGSPFYIQIVCNRLVEYMNRKRAKFVTEADVKQIRNDLISGVNALDIGKFDNLINSGDMSPDAISDKDALKVLTLIAVNSRTGLCNRNSIVCETKTPMEEILRDLVNREVIEQRDQNYRIRVELFKEWLIAHPIR